MYKLKNGWVQSVKQVPSPNYDLRPENIEISLLVIHGISLPPGIFDNEFVEEFFTNQLDHTKDPYFDQLINLKVSSHLYIKRSGEIIQFVSLDHRAWHAGLSEYNGRSNCNDFRFTLMVSFQPLFLFWRFSPSAGTTFKVSANIANVRGFMW